MSQLILFNKPFGVISQFSPEGEHKTLKDFINVPNVYPAGRLDTDSEGLLLLTDDGALQAQLSSPKFKQPKTYWVQVEGQISDDALVQLSRGVQLNDGMTLPADAKQLTEPHLWSRDPPVRFRKNIPTSWLSLTIREGRNRQVRRMTASVGFPTLRLVRYSVGEWTIENLGLGEWKRVI